MPSEINWRSKNAHQASSMGASVTLERRSNHGGEGQTLADADEVEVEQVRPKKRVFPVGIVCL